VAKEIIFEVFIVEHAEYQLWLDLLYDSVFRSPIEIFIQQGRCKHN